MVKDHHWLGTSIRSFLPKFDVDMLSVIVQSRFVQAQIQLSLASFEVVKMLGTASEWKILKRSSANSDSDGAAKKRRLPVDFLELPAELACTLPSDLPVLPGEHVLQLPANLSGHASSGPENALACKIDDLPADLPFHLGAMFWGGACYFQMCETKTLRYAMSC